ncbi:MAG: hypothetical protein L0219_13005, partial [Phycisphaerales bacterium]|nr:hypothetical protein [Phycisphaerales bacterium]
VNLRRDRTPGWECINHSEPQLLRKTGFGVSSAGTVKICMTFDAWVEPTDEVRLQRHGAAAVLGPIRAESSWQPRLC